jgi:SAM-dependent methyltransferase
VIQSTDQTSAAAYSAGADAWQEGPVQLYGTMAELLVARAPIDLRDCAVLDLGTGTGAASRPAVAAGANVVAIDNASGMVETNRATRPPGLVGDATVLPFRSGTFDVVVAAFSLNHLDDPSAGVREAGRVARSDGCLLASTYAKDDDHPVKHAVEQALREVGWEMPAWYPQMKQSMAAWGTVEEASAAVARGGMEPLTVERLDIPFPALGTGGQIGWRLGMAQHANFVHDLDDQQRRAVVRRATELLGPHPEPLVRRVIFITARAR